MHIIIDNDLIFYTIQNFLNPMDLFSLRQLNKYFLKKVKQNSVYRLVLRNMNDMLTEIFGDNATEFKRLIELTRAVISGSFITQCILNEYWEGSDIDVFISIDNEPIYDIIKKFLREKMNFKERNYDPDYLYTYVGFRSIDTMISYKTHYDIEYSICVILVDIKNDDLIKYVWDNCDFDICRNAYYINDNKEKLNICAINDICTRTTKFKIGRTLRSTIYRYYKYVERGFHIIRDIQYEDLIKLSDNFCCDPVPILTYEIFKIKKIDQPFILSDEFINIKHKVEKSTYKLVEGNPIKLSASDDRDYKFFLINDVLIILQEYKKCVNDHCPLIFCGSDIQHIHFYGIYRSDGACSNFILVIID